MHVSVCSLAFTAQYKSLIRGLKYGTYIWRIIMQFWPILKISKSAKAQPNIKRNGRDVDCVHSWSWRPNTGQPSCKILCWTKSGLTQPCPATMSSAAVGTAQLPTSWDGWPWCVSRYWKRGMHFLSNFPAWLPTSWDRWLRCVLQKQMTRYVHSIMLKAWSYGLI